jgi:hypothetical protein
VFYFVPESEPQSSAQCVGQSVDVVDVLTLRVPSRLDDVIEENVAGQENDGIVPIWRSLK